MTTSTTEREQRRLQEVAREYRRKGYEVFVYPEPAQLPEFLQTFQPDIIASKEDQWVVLEVKTRKSLVGSEDLSRLAEAVASQPSWELRLVLTNPRNGEEGLELVGEKPATLTSEEIRELLSSAEHMLESQSKEVAILLLGCAMEAAIRILSKREKIPLRGKTFLHNAKHLVAYGALKEGEYHLMEEVYRSRNSLIHGYRPEPIETRRVLSAIHLISGIIKQPLM